MPFVNSGAVNIVVKHVFQFGFLQDLCSAVVCQMVWWQSFCLINQPLYASLSGSTDLLFPQQCRRVPFAPGCVQNFLLADVFTVTLLTAVRGNLVAVLICLPVIIGDVELVSLCFG